ncbi:MAG TPA: MraY family glycosyltransferase [Pyrinomonadaceae bacterium]|nr:MraY family glycosyltransferase [Pyrinomonadaceae bacterium]
MNTYIALFIIATGASLVITPLVRRACERFKLLDVPIGARRLHKVAVPRLGGVAIFLSFLLTLSTLPLVSNMLTASLRARTTELLITLVPATLVLLLGIYDDLRGTNATTKFVGLGLIATLFYAMGGRIEALGIPFVGTISFPPVISFFLTVFWLVAISNAFNLIDGMDGLAPGAALLSSLVILIISIGQFNSLMIVVTLILCGALAGFLRYNFNPASIFLGDSGSLFVGFLLASISVLSAQKATTAVAVLSPILAFGLPVVDTSVTMARRLISRRSLFEGDGEHIHHMLLARGWSQRRVVLILYAVCAVFGLVAALSASRSAPLEALVLLVISVAVTVAVGHLRYHEVDELRAGVRRTVGGRRVRVANNIRVRRASLALSKASSLNELFEAVTQMLEFEEFAFANAQLGYPSSAESNVRAFNASHQKGVVANMEFRNGRVAWSWKRRGLQQEVIGSSKFWSFRLPLSNGSGDWGWLNLYRPLDSSPLLLEMDYVAGILRKELSDAAERIFRDYEKPLSSSHPKVRTRAKEVTG